jgi:hypothetical protein
MDTFSRDLGDALLLDYLFSLHILNFSSQNLDVKGPFQKQMLPTFVLFNFPLKMNTIRPN